MGIGVDTKSLIEAVADNDLQKAKKYVKIIIANDSSDKNEYFRKRINNKLNTSSMNLMELPQNIKGMISVEDVSVSFNKDRYFLPSAEFDIYNKVVNTWKVNEKLTELGIHYTNSLLLYGESGCGKTMLGRYIAYKLGLPFAYMNFSHIISSFLGTTGKNIAEVFGFITKNKYVFMIDEVDAIGLERGSSKEVGEMSRIVINLMQSLDALDNGTILIGATNRQDTVDKALIRRFSTQHEIKLPSEEARYHIIKKFIQTIPDAKYYDDNIELLAGLTDGWNTARIINLIIDFIVNCLVENKPINIVDIKVNRMKG